MSLFSVVTLNPQLKRVFAAVLVICCSANTCQASAAGATKITWVYRKFLLNHFNFRKEEQCVASLGNLPYNVSNWGCLTLSISQIFRAFPPCVHCRTFVLKCVFCSSFTNPQRKAESLTVNRHLKWIQRCSCLTAQSHVNRESFSL